MILSGDVKTIIPLEGRKLLLNLESLDCHLNGSWTLGCVLDWLVTARYIDVAIEVLHSSLKMGDETLRVHPQLILLIEDLTV